MTGSALQDAAIPVRPAMTAYAAAPRSRWNRYALMALALPLVLVLFLFRGHIVCYSFYPECNPWLPVPDMPDWDVPTNPNEKAMYDLAHSLKVPDSVAKPVPFDFKAARLNRLYGGRTVEQQYFEHLCATESRDYVFRRVADVEGFQVMRPRPETMETPTDYERYAVEEPVGFGWQNDDDQLDRGSKYRGDLLASDYIQPLNGVYSFVELIDPSQPEQIWRVERVYSAKNKNAKFGIEGNWGGVRVPYIQGRREVTELASRYGYLWRGLRRERDRELGIGGGDFFVIDLSTHEVLGLRRTFNSTFAPKNPRFTKWSAARECFGLDKTSPVPVFINRVLNPPLNVNDEFVPASKQAEYHAYLKRLMETGNARN